MKNENFLNQDNFFSEKNDQNQNQSQKQLNKSISSDTIKILSLLKSYPSTATSFSIQLDNKQLINSISLENNNSNNNNNINNNSTKFNNNYYDNLSYEEIKAICLKVFIYYAKPSKGQFYLSHQYIFNILKDMEILSENCLSYVDIEILLQQINKRGDKLNSEQFLDLLAKICCLLDDNFYKDKKGSFIKMIKLYIGPYLQKKNRNDLTNNTMNISGDDVNLNLNFKDLILNEYKFDKDSFDILMSIIEGLKIIYVTYFSIPEITSKKDIPSLTKDSFNIFLKFLKDFEIMPILIKQRLAELYWYIIISIDIKELYNFENNENFENSENIFKSFLNNPKYNLGRIYTFKKFFLLFSHMSFYYYNSIKSKTKGQKLLYFIEKIYRSKGYQNMPNIYNKTFSKKYSIIPPISVVEKVNKTDNKIISTQKKNLNDYIKLNKDNYKLLEEYIEPLKIIFDIYCHLYDRYQNGKMHFSNFQKMLLDGELINMKYKNNINTNETGKENNYNSTNKKSNLNNSNDKDIFIESNNNNISIDNKNLKSTTNISKSKLKLEDLDIIISKVCGDAYLSDYHQSKYNTDNNSSTFRPNYNKQSYDTNNNLVIENYNSNTNQNLNRTSKSYIIDFISFLKTLPLIASKIYPNENNDINLSMNNFLVNDIETFISNLNKKSLNISQNNEFNSLLKLISSNDEMNQLINDIAPLLKSHFIFYTGCNKEKLYDFDLFLRFFKDYEIYPTWINLSNLAEIFFSQIYKQNKEKNDFLKNPEKIDYPQFLECFVAVGLTMNSGDDFDLVDKVLFLIDKMFSENYGKIIKKIKNLPSFKEDIFYYEKILSEKYPSYYERKFSNCNHRYDNKFYWVYQKNYGSERCGQQIDFGELFNREKVKFNDVFDELNCTENKDLTYKSNNEPINEIKEE